MNAGFPVYSFPYVQYIHVRKKLSFDKKGVESLYLFELSLGFDEIHFGSCGLNSTNNARYFQSNPTIENLMVN